MRRSRRSTPRGRARRGGRLLATRLAIAAGTLLLISVITFAATNAVPSDPARVALGKTASPEQLAEYREQEGLDEPVVGRYFDWLGRYVTGDWGHSVLAGQTDVRDEVVPRLFRTLLLGVIAVALSVAVAFALGVATGRRSGRAGDLLTSIVTLVFNSLPEFVTGLLVLVVFAVQLEWLPIESASGIFYGSGADAIKSYVLPVLTLVLVLSPYMTRMVRTNVREVLQQPMVRSAILRGLPTRTVVWRHVVPNAAIPVVSVIALTLADIIAGIVVVETVFAFPGIGQLFVSSVLGKDVPVVQAVALVVGLGFVTINLLADALLVAIDPRLRTRA
jgi:peptide/nickel transport system permease protein